MKKFLLALTLAAAGLCAVSCYNDSAVWDEIETLKSRMAALEKAYSELTDYKTIMQNMEAVKSIVQNADGSYTINFFNADPITIANGSAGVAGKDGATPSFKIDNGQWYVSYDDGATWTLIGEAAGNSLFQNAYMDGEDYFVIVLLDGTQVRIPLKGGGGPGGEGGGQGGEGGGQGGEQSGYEAWLGTWTLQGNSVTLAQKVKDQSFTMTDNNGLNAEITYNSEGTISLKYPSGGQIGTMSDGSKILIRGYASSWVSSSAGDVMVTWTLSADKTTATAVAGSGMTGVYVYAYLTSSSYTTNFGNKSIVATMTKVSGGDQGGQGGGDSGSVSFNDWIGDWTLQGQTCTIVSKEDGESLQISCGILHTVLTYKSDGSVDLAYPTYGWLGVDEAQSNYYFSVTDTANGWATVQDGEVVATWTLSGDKKTATVSPASGFKNAYIYAYDASDNYLGYTSVFGQKGIFANMTKN